MAGEKEQQVANQASVDIGGFAEFMKTWIGSSTSPKDSTTTSKTSGSATTLIESKTYENPQFLRIKDLMSKM